MFTPAMILKGLDAVSIGAIAIEGLIDLVRNASAEARDLTDEELDAEVAESDSVHMTVQEAVAAKIARDANGGD